MHLISATEYSTWFKCGVSLLLLPLSIHEMCVLLEYYMKVLIWFRTITKALKILCSCGSLYQPN